MVGDPTEQSKLTLFIFICTAVKAIHLELVTNLRSSEGFLDAFRRFTSRRGHCFKLFTRATRELKESLTDCTKGLSKEKTWPKLVWSCLYYANFSENYRIGNKTLFLFYFYSKGQLLDIK